MSSISGTEGTARGRRRGLYLLLALLVSGLAAVAAPSDWPEGEGRLLLEYEGREVVGAEVEVGATEPVAVGVESGEPGRIEIDFPSGIPVDAPIEGAVKVSTGGEVIQPALEDIRLTLELSDGRRELLPATAWNEDAHAVEILRRPTVDAALIIGLLGFVVVMWVTETWPLFVTSLLIPVVIVVAGVGSAAAATAPFANPIIVLFFAGFLMAEAMKRADLDHYVSINITARAGRSVRFLFFAMLSLAAFLSMWMSNTAATAVLVPIAMAITAPLAHEGFRRALILGLAYAATIGGVGSAIGTPANQLAIEFLGDYAGDTITFAEWFGYGLPMVALFLPIMGWYLWRRSGVNVDPVRFDEVRRLASEEAASLGSPSSQQKVVLIVFALVAVGWLTQVVHEVHPGIVALGGAVALFVLGKLKAEDLGRISWPSLLTFGGGLTLGVFLVESGTSDWVATRLAGLSAVPPLVAILSVATITLILTTIASNTASAAILIPMSIPLAAVLGIDPTLLVVVVAIVSSIDFALVIGTPPTMIAYSTRLYTAGDIFRKGALLDVAGLLLLVLVVTQIWGWLGLV